MTYYVSSGTLNSTNSTQLCLVITPTMQSEDAASDLCQRRFTFIVAPVRPSDRWITQNVVEKFSWKFLEG